MQPSDFLQCGRGRSEPVGPPTGNAQEAERRATGGQQGSLEEPHGPPVQTKVPSSLWPLGSLALGGECGNEEPGLNDGLRADQGGKRGLAMTCIQDHGRLALHLSEVSGTRFHWTLC